MKRIENQSDHLERTGSLAGPDHERRGRHLSALISSKIDRRHRDRLAAIYVRQSSARQVSENRESTELQYRLRERAVALGWPDPQVLVIDDDLGQSGQSIAGRPGFQRLLAEVGLDHVGLVLSIEMSRLARSCRDWHQLLELCAVFGTLLGDADGIYDPRDYNDRLLLGLKGTMSEAELHILRSRLDGGRRNKAQRGELFTQAPIGYVRSGDDELALEPDEQARRVVQLIFAKFAELGSVSAVLRYLDGHQILVGVRDHRGSEAGQLQWRPANRATLQNMLHHPIYAGAYVHGRRHTDPRKQIAGRPGTGRKWVGPNEWEVLLRDHLPAYISWEQYGANLRQMHDNSPQFGRGAPRDGCALLGGLVVCGRCHRRMSLSYVRPCQYRLTCDGARNHTGVSQCQALGAEAVEELVTCQVLLALEPASLELSMAAADQIEAERRRLEEYHEQSLERARYEADRAWRQYTAVEPEHRMVARELERRWEEALAKQHDATEALERFRRQQPSRLTDEQRQRVRALATDVPALWSAASTRPSDRQVILRQLIEQIEVTVQGGKERVEIVIRWVGGAESRHEVRRQVGSYEHLEKKDELVARFCELKDEGLSQPEIACQLNAEGFRGPSGKEFTIPMVSQISRRLVGAGAVTQERDAGATPSDHPVPSRWRCKALSKKLDVPMSTLNTWRRREWVHARWNGRFWIYWANEAELERLAKLRSHPRVALTPVPTDLSTPTGPPPWEQ